MKIFNYFHPQLLEKAVQEVREKHKKTNYHPETNLVELLEEPWINKLSNAINNTSLEEIDVLGVTLSPREVKVLPHLWIKNLTPLYRKKIRKLLTKNASNTLIRPMWNFLQEEYQNEEFINLSQDLTPFLSKGGNKKRYEMWSKIIETTSISEAITNLIIEIGSLKNFQEEFRFNNRKGKLFKEVLANYLRNATEENMLAEKDNLKEYYTVLWENDPETAKSAIHHFFNTLSEATLFTKDFEDLIEYFTGDMLLGNPVREENTNWEGVLDTAPIRKWYVEHNLESFYDYLGAGNHEEMRRRVGFWVGFNSHFVDFDVITESKQCFFIFRNFAVVEFGDLGNAAYIYSRDYFDKKFAYIMKKKRLVDNSRLKDQMNVMFKLYHSGAWQERWQHRITSLLEYRDY